MRHSRSFRWASLLSSILFILAGCTASVSTVETEATRPSSSVTYVPASAVPSPAFTRQPTLPPESSTLPPEPSALPPEPSAAPTQDLPASAYFVVTPTTALTVGAPLSITWAATGDKASLCFISGLGPTGCQDVALQGSTTVIITEDMLAYLGVGFKVTVGSTFTWSIVDLHFQCAASWFFEDSPSRCPAEAPIYSQAAAQYFEHGFMIWTGTPDRFYVFFDEGQEFLFWDAPYYFVTPEPVNATPPPGYQEPISGFGKVWRGELGGTNASDLRQRLGWATAPEFAFDAIYQCELPAHPHLWLCYLRGPDGMTLRLHPDSSAQVRFLWERQ